MSNDPEANIDEGKPNASMSVFLPMSGTDSSRSKNRLCDALVHVSSVSPKMPCTKTTATRLAGFCWMTQRESVVLTPSRNRSAVGGSVRLAGQPARPIAAATMRMFLRISLREAQRSSDDLRDGVNISETKSPVQQKNRLRTGSVHASLAARE